MKVLWITNILFPEAEQLLTGAGELKSTGGWMLGMANALIDSGRVELFVAAVSGKTTVLKKLNGKNIVYYILPMGSGNTRINYEYCHIWKKINEDIKPDIIHIHGTEFSHGHAYMKACGSRNVIISIQGLMSAYYYYYYYGMTKVDIYKNLTIRDILRGTIIGGQKDFKKRSEYEIDMLRMTRHIIGRTSWDKARTWAINPDAKYHFCNEVLRPEFYDATQWSYENCRKHSIFLSQAGYPLKGLHQVLKAMPLILRYFPDTTVRVAGGNITECYSISQKLKISGYGHYIKSLIKKYQLKDKIFFTGNLNALEMRQEYLNANVFICPSAIENSPNSLGEAQILGVPCIASYAGGIMDMMKGNEENLYRFEEIEMLAKKVCRVFSDKECQKNMQPQALHRHDIEINCSNLLQIYELIFANAGIK